jgi:hypothetical protein
MPASRSVVGRARKTTITADRLRLFLKSSSVSFRIFLTGHNDTEQLVGRFRQIINDKAGEEAIEVVLR